MGVFLVGYGMGSMILSGMLCGTVRYSIVWCGTVCDMVCQWYGMMARCGGNIIWHGIRYGTLVR